MLTSDQHLTDHPNSATPHPLNQPFGADYLTALTHRIIQAQKLPNTSGYLVGLSRFRHHLYLNIDPHLQTETLHYHFRLFVLLLLSVILTLFHGFKLWRHWRHPDMAIKKTSVNSDQAANPKK